MCAHLKCLHKSFTGINSDDSTCILACKIQASWTCCIYEPTHAIEVSLGYKAIKVIDLGIGNW
jgi:hypothetical protein